MEENKIIFTAERGKDDNETNFQQLLKLRTENDEEVINIHHRKFKILNEMALSILSNVVDSIKGAGFQHYA